MANAKGYDVSEFQRGIPADAEFVFIKASEGGYTDEPGYAEKLAEARRRGLVVGHYHVLHAENPVEGERLDGSFGFWRRVGSGRLPYDQAAPLP